MKRVALLLLLALVAAPPAVWAGSRALVIDSDQSQIQIDISATLFSFVATLGDFDATIFLDPDASAVESASFHFLFTDLKSGEADRDAEMYKWEQADRFPDGGFILDTVETSDTGRYTAHGHLRFHGVTRAVTFPFDVMIAGHTMTIDGESPLDTRDYGLPIFRKLLLFKVEPVVHVRFHLVGHLASP